MSGVGRRTLYRKSVTDEYLNTNPEPGENEEIALVQAPRGSNIMEIMLANGEQALAILPTRFRKLIWVKRGDFLITSTSAGDFETSAGEAGKVRHRVEHILSRDHIKHLQKEGMWPEVEAFRKALDGPSRQDGADGKLGWEGPATTTAAAGKVGSGVESDSALNTVDEGLRACSIDDGRKSKPSSEGPYDKDESEEDEDDMSDLFVNNNRAAMMQLRMDHGDSEDSESESDSDEEQHEDR